MTESVTSGGALRRIADALTFERLVCVYAASVPWMPFVNVGSAPLNTAYLFGLVLWGLLFWRRGAALSVPLTPGLVLGAAVFLWMLVGAVGTGSLKTALVDLLHFANFLLGYALILATVRTPEMVGRVLKAMLVSSFLVAAFGIGLSFVVNVLDLQAVPRFMVDVLGKFLYGARGQEMLIGYGTEMGNWYRDGLFRTVSVFFNPMQNSEYTMFFLFLAFGQVLAGSDLLPRKILVLGTGLLALQLFVSFSRTAYFGAIAGGGGFFALLLVLGVVPRRQVLLMLSAGGAAMLLFSPLAGAYVVKTAMSIGDMHQFSNAGRLVAMAAGVLVWMHHPWFGTGWGNTTAMAFGNLDLSQPNLIESLVLPHIREALLYAKAVVFGELFEQTNYHSGHLILLAQLGVFGMLLYWAWQSVWVRSAWRLALEGSTSNLRGLGLGFVGAWGTVVVCLIVDDNLFYPKYALPLFLVAGLVDASRRAASPAGISPGTSRFGDRSASSSGERG